MIDLNDTIVKNDFQFKRVSKTNSPNDCTSCLRENSSTNSIHDSSNNLILCHHHRKSYPQRHNRSKLNYRDLERGMYEEIRSSLWNLENPSGSKKRKMTCDSNGDNESIENSTDSDEFSRLPWCICKKPWDHLRVMLRCDSCCNWYHHDCIGIEKEKALKVRNGNDSFTCLLCEGIHSAPVSDIFSLNQSNITKSKDSNRTTSDLSKRSNDSQVQSKKNNPLCMIRSCRQVCQSGSIYCSSICIRRHVYDTVQLIQRSKDDAAGLLDRQTFLLYDSRTKKYFEKSSSLSIESLYDWLNDHRSYEIVKPSQRQAILKLIDQSKDSTTPVPKSSAISKSIVKKKTAVVKQQAKKPSNVDRSTTEDIRSKVVKALQEKLVIRLEKAEEPIIDTDQIQDIVDRIEKEMFRVYGKVDNSYKNKFRSLLANISNMNNRFFYKQIVSNQYTAAQIVAMKPEDMLPPEEKEKRRDEFNREVQLIIEAEAQAAEALARRKNNIQEQRPGLIEHFSLSPKPTVLEKNDEIEKTVAMAIDSTPVNVEITARPDQSTITNSLPITGAQLIPVESTMISKPVIAPPPSNSQKNLKAFSISADSDDDYIEPESPTGADALIYDDEDEEEKIAEENETVPRKTSIDVIDLTHDDSPPRSTLENLPRDDYNPSKICSNVINQSSSGREIVHWQGTISSSEVNIACRSIETYGDNDALIQDIPARLAIVGRLRIADLWNYIRDSLVIRDIILLKIVSSGSTSVDIETFSQYAQMMRHSSRAGVIAKRLDSSSIRDIYVLPADTQDCPNSVLSALSLTKTHFSSELFLAIIGSAKKTNKLVSQSDERTSSTTSIYKPITVHNSAVLRDPRLSKSGVKQSIHQSNSNENFIVKNSTNGTRIPGDNLMEENMEVDESDDGDVLREKIKKPSNATDSAVVIDEQIKVQQKVRKRKSRFSDAMPTSQITFDDQQSSTSLLDNSQPSLLNSKFRPIINVCQTSSIPFHFSNRFPSKPVRFSFAKDPLRYHKSSFSSTKVNAQNSTRHIDPYENSAKLFEDFMKSKNLSFRNDRWSTIQLPVVPLRTEAMVNLRTEKQKTKHRVSSQTRDWRMSHSNYTTQYYDFDRPEE